MNYQSFGKKVKQYRKQETLISICNALNVSPQALLAADLTSCDPSRVMEIDADQKNKLLHLFDLAAQVIAGYDH